MLMTDEEKAIKAMKIRENFMTTNRSGASTLNGRRPESEPRLNVSRPSHGRKLGGFHLYLFPFNFPFNYIANYSRVWNKHTPLNKRSPLENLSKRIIVAPFLPYTMKSGIRP